MSDPRQIKAEIVDRKSMHTKTQRLATQRTYSGMCLPQPFMLLLVRKDSGNLGI
jgi:hypothetical protein